MTDITELSAAVTTLLAEYGLTRDQFADLMTGPVDGGPNADGYYSFTTPSGTTVLVPSPLKIAALAARTAFGVINVSYATRAELNADLNWIAGKIGFVTNDSTTANNDFYVKVGASGAGSWTRTTILNDAIAAAAAAKLAEAAASASAAAGSATAAGTARDAAQTAALAILPIVPAYANTGGTGDRRSMITITATTGLFDLAQGAVANLINGSAANDSTNSAVFTNGIAVSGKRIRLDFGAGASKVLTAFRWKQQLTTTHGSWHVEASNDDESMTALTTTATLGGSTSQEIAFAGNLTGYRYYYLVGDSGTASNATYINEIELKIAPAATDGYVKYPANPKPLANLRVQGSATGLVEWESSIIGGSQQTNLLGAWDFLRGVSGTKVIDGTGNGYDMDLSLPAAQSYRSTVCGIKLTGGLADTTKTIVGARLFALLYRVPRDEGATGTRQILSAGNPSNGGLNEGLFGQDVQLGWNYWYMSSQGLVPLIYDTTTGEVAYQLNRGGYVLVFAEMPAAYDTKLGLGGLAGGTANRCTEIELVLARAWGATMTLDQMKAEALAIRRQAMARGIRLHADDCPKQIDVTLQWGQSDLTGYSCIYGYAGNYDYSVVPPIDTFQRGQPGQSLTGAISADDLFAADFAPNSFISHMNSNAGGQPLIEQFRFRYNHRQGFEKKYYTGPSIGAVIANEENNLIRQRPFLLIQSAIDSTALAKFDAVTPSGTAVRPPTQTWNVGYTASQASIWYTAMKHWADVEQHLLLQGLGPVLRAIWWWQGGEDGIYTYTANAWQASMQALWNKSKTSLWAGATPLMVLIKYQTGGRATLENQDGPATGPTSAMEIMRTGHVNFDGANADVTLVSIDDLPIQADGHLYGSAQVTIGRRLYAATPALVSGV